MLTFGILALGAFIYSCSKEENIGKTNLSSLSNQKSDNANVMGKLNRNKNLFKYRLDLMAKSLVGLMQNPQFVSLVAVETSKKTYEEVLFSTLISKMQSSGTDLKALLTNSLTSCGVSQADITSFNQWIDSFSVEGFTFKPKIIFRVIDSTEFNRGSWDGKTPCYSGVSLLNIPSNNIPVYRLNGGVLEKTEKNVYLMETTPIWYMSFSHNVPIYDGTGRIDRQNVHDFFRQMADCECCLTNDEKPEDRVEYCDFENPNAGSKCDGRTDPQSGECNGNCVNGIVNPKNVTICTN